MYLRAKEVYAEYEGHQERPSKGEVMLWCLYGLCSYFIHTVIIPILFPLLISQIFEAPEPLQGWEKSFKGLSCTKKEMQVYCSRSTLVMPTCNQLYEGESVSKVSTWKVSVLSISSSTDKGNSMLGGLELNGSISAKPLVGKVFTSAGSCTYPGSSIESHSHIAEEKIGVLLLNSSVVCLFYANAIGRYCAQELVTFGSHPLSKPPEISDVGRHLSAAEFHSVLQNGGQLVKENDSKKLVLLDARNMYETRIRKFHTPNAETLDPAIRQYSDLPSWIDNNSEKLKGNCVLMYCTGGIRCEMASAYVRSKGAEFENVFQLYGGIQRYLEQYPDGGFFEEKILFLTIGFLLAVQI